MTVKDKIILLFGAFAFITACIIYEFNRVGAVYFLGQAIAFVSYATVLYRLHKNIVTEIILVLTIGQLLDELFGNPEVF